MTSKLGVHKLGPVILVLCLATFACGGSKAQAPAPPTKADASPPSPQPSTQSVQASAHSLLLDTSEVPGGTWTVSARDNFDHDTNFSTETIGVSSCDDMSRLASLDILFGDAKGDKPADKAKIEFVRPGADPTFPTSVEEEVDFQPTATDMQTHWPLAKQLLGSANSAQCISNLVKASLATEGTKDNPVDVTVNQIDSPSVPPNGAAQAVHFVVKRGSATLLDGSQYLYIWPKGNEETVVTLIGSTDLTPKLASDIILAIQKKVDAAVK